MTQPLPSSDERPLDPQERSTGGRGFEGFLGEARPCHGAQVSRQTPGGWAGFYRQMSKCHIDLKRMKQIS